MQAPKSNGWLNAGRSILRVLDGITNAMAAMSGLFLCAMVTIICISVVLRYFFHFSAGWTTELTEYFIFVMVMLGSPWVLREDNHVVVDVVYAMVGRRTRKVFAVATNFLGFLVGAAYVYYGLQATVENFLDGTMLVKIMPIPKWMPLAFIPIMSFFVMYWFARKTVKYFRTPSTDRMYQQS